jgi:hypothetical protein
MTNYVTLAHVCQGLEKQSRLEYLASDNYYYHRILGKSGEGAYTRDSDSFCLTTITDRRLPTWARDLCTFWLSALCDKMAYQTRPIVQNALHEPTIY